jgi:hypothetical protein
VGHGLDVGDRVQEITAQVVVGEGAVEHGLDVGDLVHELAARRVVVEEGGGDTERGAPAEDAGVVGGGSLVEKEMDQTAVKKRSAREWCVEVDTAVLIRCELREKPTNHKWETFDRGGWVTNGRLKDECCGGVRDETVCGKVFVATEKEMAVDGGTFRPSTRTPAWGCTECRVVMCDPCKVYYEAYQRMTSPARSRRLVVR